MWKEERLKMNNGWVYRVNGSKKGKWIMNVDERESMIEKNNKEVMGWV